MSQPLKAPELVKYELLEEIGHGGMATVYRARDKRLGREVALKLIHRHLRQSPEILRRFILEATTIAKLKHRNVVEVYDVSDEGSLERFLVVELIEGGTLRDILNQGPLSPEVAAAIVVEVGEGLAHAHLHGVVHRDVKPENVLLELPSGSERLAAGTPAPPVKVKLTDFGIAKLLDAHGLTSTGQVLGSPSHMAPEQIDGGKVDERADVFALGVLFYECLVGKLPFAGEHPAQVLRKVLAGEYTPAERAQPRVGIAYSRIVSRALSRAPEQRYPTIRAMLNAIVHELGLLKFGSTGRLLQSLAVHDDSLDALIVERLIERGDQARAGGDVSGATDALGRALVYCPADRQLIRRLSGLTRRLALREAARWSGIAAIVLSMAVGLIVLDIAPDKQKRGTASPVGNFAGPEEVKAVKPERESSHPAAVQAAASGSRSATDAVAVASSAMAIASIALPKPQSVAVQQRSAGSGARAISRRSGVVGAPRRRATAPVEPLPIVRKVVVRITGAMGGTLKIDGEPKQWFGDVQHSLTVGSHHFEFVTPDLTCCKSRSKTVEITEGEGVQKVLGQIPFIEATLRVTSTERGLGRLECSTLFSGPRSFPGELQVPMARLQVTGVCTLRNELPGALPQRRVIRLRAGRTTVIPWP